MSSCCTLYPMTYLFYNWSLLFTPLCPFFPPLTSGSRQSVFLSSVWRAFLFLFFGFWFLVFFVGFFVVVFRVYMSVNFDQELQGKQKLYLESFKEFQSQERQTWVETPAVFWGAKKRTEFIKTKRGASKRITQVALKALWLVLVSRFILHYIHHWLLMFFARWRFYFFNGEFSDTDPGPEDVSDVAISEVQQVWFQT